jgi:hypothetical protein
MSDKYQLSPPSTVFEAGIKSLADKGFGVSSWPGYTTTVIFTQGFRNVKKPETTKKQGFEVITLAEDIPQ